MAYIVKVLVIDEGTGETKVSTTTYDTKPMVLVVEDGTDVCSDMVRNYDTWLERFWSEFNILYAPGMSGEHDL